MEGGAGISYRWGWGWADLGLRMHRLGASMGKGFRLGLGTGW